MGPHRWNFFFFFFFFFFLKASRWRISENCPDEFQNPFEAIRLFISVEWGNQDDGIDVGLTLSFTVLNDKGNEPSDRSLPGADCHVAGLSRWCRGQYFGTRRGPVSPTSSDATHSDTARHENHPSDPSPKLEGNWMNSSAAVAAAFPFVFVCRLTGWIHPP